MLLPRGSSNLSIVEMLPSIQNPQTQILAKRRDTSKPTQSPIDMNMSQVHSGPNRTLSSPNTCSCILGNVRPMLKGFLTCCSLASFLVQTFLDRSNKTMRLMVQSLYGHF